MFGEGGVEILKISGVVELERNEKKEHVCWEPRPKDAKEVRGRPTYSVKRSVRGVMRNQISK